MLLLLMFLLVPTFGVLLFPDDDHGDHDDYDHGHDRDGDDGDHVFHPATWA